MRIKLYQIKKSFYWLFVWPPLLCYFLTPKRHRENLKKDLRRAYEIRKLNPSKYFIWDLYTNFALDKTFRVIYYMRIGHYSKLFKWLYKGETLCGISMKRDFVGGGLFIQHGWSSTLGATSVGENLWTNQLVVVGNRGSGRPIIGNNVRIGTGAKVLGGIKIGNNVNIGAGAIVVKDVPDNCTVVSPPAYIVKRNGIKVHEEL